MTEPECDGGWDEEWDDNWGECGPSLVPDPTPAPTFSEDCGAIDDDNSEATP